VLTHRAPDTPVPGVTFVGDLNSGAAAAKAAAGDRYVNLLGANTAQQCLSAGVLDEDTVELESSGPGASDVGHSHRSRPARTGLDWAAKRLLCVATDGRPSGPGRSADQATML